MTFAHNLDTNWNHGWSIHNVLCHCSSIPANTRIEFRIQIKSNPTYISLINAIFTITGKVQRTSVQWPQFQSLKSKEECIHQGQALMTVMYRQTWIHQDSTLLSVMIAVEFSMLLSTSSLFQLSFDFYLFTVRTDNCGIWCWQPCQEFLVHSVLLTLATMIARNPIILGNQVFAQIAVFFPNTICKQRLKMWILSKGEFHRKNK